MGGEKFGIALKSLAQKVSERECLDAWMVA